MPEEAKGATRRYYMMSLAMDESLHDTNVTSWHVAHAGLLLDSTEQDNGTIILNVPVPSALLSISPTQRQPRSNSSPSSPTFVDHHSRALNSDILQQSAAKHPSGIWNNLNVPQAGGRFEQRCQ